MKYRRLLLVEPQDDAEKTFPAVFVKIHQEVTGGLVQMWDWPCGLGYQGNMWSRGQQRQNQILLEDGSTEGVMFNLDLDRWIMPRKDVPGRGNSLYQGWPALSAQHQQCASTANESPFRTRRAETEARSTGTSRHPFGNSLSFFQAVSAFELLVSLQNFLPLGILEMVHIKYLRRVKLCSFYWNASPGIVQKGGIIRCLVRIRQYDNKIQGKRNWSLINVKSRCGDKPQTY